MTQAKSVSVWEESVGSIPYKVTVLEMATRKNVLYLKWREKGNWEYMSLKRAALEAGFPTGSLFDEKGQRLAGRALAKKQIWAVEQAEAQFARLKAGLPSRDQKIAEPLKLKEVWALVSSPETGKYIADSAHRREVKRELDHAVRILGGDIPVASIRKDTLEKLWRARIREVNARGADGLRPAEITIARILAIGTWLREKELIPADALLHPPGWKNQLRDDWTKITQSDRLPAVRRPRHKVDELRKLLDEAWNEDPRLGLLLGLGAELRGGQVLRARRSDIDLEKNAFSVPGSGKKGGTVLHLTPGQRAAVDRAMNAESGYLRELEAAYQAGTITDYFLFPRGQMPGIRAFRRGQKFDPSKQKSWQPEQHPYMPLARVVDGAQPIGRNILKEWFAAAEKRAGITHVKGRGLYGLRRAGVDAAKELGISREGLQELGGWSDSQIPDSIYAEQTRGYARDEAAKTRARARGETVTDEAKET